jgi:predicted N-acetyltransferase YhbS
MIEQLALPVSDDDIRDLALLLLDAIDSGASVGFLDSTTLESAEAWWRDRISKADERAIFLVSRDENGIAGTVQMLPAGMPNQRHRADIAKLLIHRRARRKGLGSMLMKEMNVVRKLPASPS